MAEPAGSPKGIILQLASKDPRALEGTTWNDNDNYKFTDKKTVRDEATEMKNVGGQDKVRYLGYDLTEFGVKQGGPVDSSRLTESSKAFAKAIPLPDLLVSLHRMSQERALGIELTIYIPFVVAFCFFFLAGRSIEDGFYMGKGVYDTVTGEFPNVPGVGPYWEKTMADIRTPSDWYQWMEGVMLEALWAGVDDDVNATINNTFSGYNLKLGSLRIRTWRMLNNTCAVNDWWYPANQSVFPRFCYERFTEDGAFKNVNYGPRQDPQRFKFLECKEFVGRTVLGRVSTYPCGGHVLDIPFNYSKKDARALIRSLQGVSDDGSDPVSFIDPVQTRFVSVEFFLYSPVFNVFLSSKIWVEVTKGGAWLTSYKINTFEVWSLKHMPYTIYQFFFLAFVLYYVWKFFHELVVANRNGRRGWLKYLCNMWNFLEICNLITFLIVFGLRFAWWYKSRQMAFVLPGDGYIDQLDYINWLYLAQVYTNSLNTVITFLKVLKFVKLNDRLNILTRTMEACQQNIIGILAVFFLLVLAYSITATSLFGNSLERFRNLENSFSSNFLMLLGDFNYAELYEEDRFVTAVFFWSYFILALFLLLNFILAVIADSFGKENDKTRAEPLFDMVQGFFSRLARRVRAFFHAPMAKIREMFRAREEGAEKLSSGEKFARHLRLWHESHLDINEEELRLMDDDAIINHPPRTLVMRRQIKQIFEEASDEGAREYARIGESYFDNTWIDCYKDYMLHNDDEEDNEAAHERELYDTACGAVRTVLGIKHEDDEKHKGEELSEATMTVQQLFSPAEENLKIIESLKARLVELEESMSTITTSAIRLDYALTHLYSDMKSGTTGSADAPTAQLAQPTNLPPLPPLK
jgi:hypothetical protein